MQLYKLTVSYVCTFTWGSSLWITSQLEQHVQIFQFYIPLLFQGIFLNYVPNVKIRLNICCCSLLPLVRCVTLGKLFRHPVPPRSVTSIKVDFCKHYGIFFTRIKFKCLEKQLSSVPLGNNGSIYSGVLLLLSLLSPSVKPRITVTSAIPLYADVYLFDLLLHFDPALNTKILDFAS